MRSKIAAAGLATCIGFSAGVTPAHTTTADRISVPIGFPANKGILLVQKNSGVGPRAIAGDARRNAQQGKTNKGRNH